MPVGIPINDFLKICVKCGLEFKTKSNRAKYCIKCKTKKYLCDYCGKEISKTTKNRKLYCAECLVLEFNCQCGCDQKISFLKYVKGILYKKGHALKNKPMKLNHKLKIGLGNKGKKRTKEQIEKMREISKGRIVSQETCEKISKSHRKNGVGKWMLGRKLSKEICKKISLAGLGKKCSEETKIKISNANRGEKNGMFGKHHSKVVKEKISKAAKKMFQNLTEEKKEAIKKKKEETMLKKYGVKHCMHNREIALKVAKAARNSVVKNHWVDNRELVCTASYESKVVDFLNKNKIEYNWQSHIFKLIIKGKERTYRPD